MFDYYMLNLTATTICLNVEGPAPDVLTTLTPTSVPTAPTATLKPDTWFDITPFRDRVCSEAGAVEGLLITSTL